jgi:MoxR-like ATPase
MLSDEALQDWRSNALQLEAAVAQAIIGQPQVTRLITVALFARGHVLLEGDVGVGKTTLLRAFARAIGGEFERVEGTIDLMPGDLIYHTYVDAEGAPRIDPGPLLRHGERLTTFFFNEINRARPQVHSLLLRLMAERSISAFNREYHFPYLLVFADRNRIEREETFELPAAARDRFLMEIGIATPVEPDIRRALAFEPRFHDADKLIAAVPEGLLDHRELPAVAAAIQNEVEASPDLERYTLDLWQAIRDPASVGIDIPNVDMQRLVAGGASPRGMSFLLRAARVAAWLDKRNMVVPEDLRAVFFETMAHRIFFDPIYELRREPIVRELCRQLFERVPAP